MMEITQRSHVIDREYVKFFVFIVVMCCTRLQRPKQIEVERRAIAFEVPPKIWTEVHDRSRRFAKIGMNLCGGRIRVAPYADVVLAGGRLVAECITSSL